MRWSRTRAHSARPGSLRFLRDAAAELFARFRQMHPVAALAECARAFEARGTGADDEHGIVGSCAPE